MSESDSLPPTGSQLLAELIVDALVDARVVKREDVDKAVEVAEEEIRVREALGGLEFK